MLPIENSFRLLRCVIPPLLYLLSSPRTDGRAGRLWGTLRRWFSTSSYLRAWARRVVLT